MEFWTTRDEQTATSTERPHIPEKHNSGNLRAGPPSDYLPDALLLAGLQDKLVNSSCLYLLPGPEHRVIFYIAPELNHIIVVLAIGMTALAGSVDGNTICEVA